MSSSPVSIHCSLLFELTLSVCVSILLASAFLSLLGDFVLACTPPPGLCGVGQHLCFPPMCSHRLPPSSLPLSLCKLLEALRSNRQLLCMVEECSGAVEWFWTYRVAACALGKNIPVCFLSLCLKIINAGMMMENNGR